MCLAVILSSLAAVLLNPLYPGFLPLTSGIMTTFPGVPILYLSKYPDSGQSRFAAHHGDKAIQLATY